MKRYEMIREIFNNCDNSKMRDVFIEDIETDDVAEIVSRHLDSQTKLEQYVTSTGVEIYEISVNGVVLQKLTFSPLDTK